VLIQVGIVDDQPIVRWALGRYLDQQEGIHVIAQAASGREAIDLVRVNPVDVLLLDLEMPGQSGMDALAMIKATARVDHLRVLMFSGYPEHLYAVPLIRKGASGYLTKSCEPAEIVAAIRHVAQGRRWITPAVAELLAGAVTEPAPPGSHHHLSARELQIFLKLARGRKPAQVAAELSLSPKTVSAHRSSLMRKLDARSNSDLTYYALKHGLVD
jgi:two-component system, NarL family, invasion response regulator UvrY